MAVTVYPPPMVTASLAPQRAKAGTPFLFTLPVGLFSEAVSGDRLTVSQSGPSWLRFNPMTGVLSGTPTDQTTGPQSVTFTAADLVGLAASTTLPLDVIPAYRAPKAAASLAPQTAKAGTPFHFTLPGGLFSEAIPGDSLTITESGPSWLSFDASTGVLSGTPTDQTTGPQAVRFTATDLGGLKTGANLVVTVAPVYKTPLVTASLAPQVAKLGTPFHFTLPSGLFSATIPGDRLTIGETGPLWLSFNAKTGVLSGSAGLRDLGRKTVTFTATDLGGKKASARMNLDVRAISFGNVSALESQVQLMIQGMASIPPAGNGAPTTKAPIEQQMPFLAASHG